MAKKAVRRAPRRYEPPQKQVLLLTCMDLRLTDDATRFMDGFNLTNRYDHLAFAGAAMGARLLTSDGLPWSSVFFEHLAIAIETLGRDIQDIFILEHLDCGAYKYAHPDDGQQGVRQKYRRLSERGETKKQVPFHRTEALAFARQIDKYVAGRLQLRKHSLDEVKQKLLAGQGNEQDYQAALTLEKQVRGWSKIQVRSFVMDLNGGIEEL